VYGETMILFFGVMIDEHVSVSPDLDGVLIVQFDHLDPGDTHSGVEFEGKPLPPRPLHPSGCRHSYLLTPTSKRTPNETGDVYEWAYKVRYMHNNEDWELEECVAYVTLRQRIEEECTFDVVVSLNGVSFLLSLPQRFVVAHLPLALSGS